MAILHWSRMVLPVAALGLLYLMTQFARNALGVISGEIEEQLGLRATETALLAGATFLAYGLAQIPAAALLTRLGPRLVLPGAAALLTASFYGFSSAESFGELLAARIAMGIAAAPVLAGAYAIFTDDGENRFATLAGALTAFGRAGVVMATTPLALLVAAAGWRPAFLWAAAATAAAGVCTGLVLLRRAAHGAAPDVKGSFPLSGLLRSPAFRIAALFQGAASAVGSTILALWGGPWLANVYGYDIRERGVMLLVMALSWSISAPPWGRFAEHPACRRAVLISAAAVVALLLVPALIHLPEALLIPWLALVGAGTGFYPAVLAELRRAVPPGTIVYLSSLLTAGTMLVVFAAQLATGAVADLLPGKPGQHPEFAYSIIFGLLAALLGVASIACFLSARHAGHASR